MSTSSVSIVGVDNTDIVLTLTGTAISLGTATVSGTHSGTSSGTNTGDQSLFSTIAVSGQSDVVADTTTDTLTFVAGTNMTITTNAATDTITFASSGAGGVPTTITVANEATDTTCFPAFFTAASGDLGPKSNASLTYNSNTGALASTSFVGALTGDVTGNCSGTSGSTTGNAATVTTNANLTGPITSTGNATAIASQTGTGTKFVVDTGPTLVTPVLGVATATSINKVALTAPATSATLTIADGQTLTVNGSATITNGTHSGTNTGDQTNIAGNAATVTTNANLTGEVTSTGNAAVLDKTAITNRTEDLTPDSANDYVLTYDASAAALKKVLISNMPAGAAPTTLGLDYCISRKIFCA